jgi:hypothetical protein
MRRSGDRRMIPRYGNSFRTLQIEMVAYDSG